jgi:conjugal transfer pilus assembly protein TraW
LAAFIPFSEVLAKDFGIVGKVYEIAEKNMLREIEGKLEMMKSSGEIERKNQEMKQKMLSYLNRPKEVKGIIDTVEEREYYYDPSYIVNNDIADQDGRVFVMKKARVNPLEYMPLGQKLIFINGDSENQVKWAVSESKKEKIKIILVKGNLLNLMKENKVRLYFDQSGVLTSKFGIQQTPAIVEQKELKLLIKEVRVK